MKRITMTFEVCDGGAAGYSSGCWVVKVNDREICSMDLQELIGRAGLHAFQCELFKLVPEQKP